MWETLESQELIIKDVICINDDIIRIEYAYNFNNEGFSSVNPKTNCLLTGFITFYVRTSMLDYELKPYTIKG